MLCSWQDAKGFCKGTIQSILEVRNDAGCCVVGKVYGTESKIIDVECQE